MKINYIHYHNYRCFQDVKVRFDTTDKKNVSLVLGVNGSGKTEMLFSFQWVLYGFDFKSLREKDETPYSLNSGLYHELLAKRNAQSVECWVELSFTYKGSEYFMKRTELFRRENDKIVSSQMVSLSQTLPNGERTAPEKDKKIVEERLMRIIPKSILEGITFDGERMKKLNIADDQSKKVIENVISLVTNERLFELCLTEIKDVSGDVSREKIRINRSLGNATAEDLEKEINRLNDDIEDDQTSLIGARLNLQKVDARIEEISQQLAQLEEAKQLEQKRIGLQKDFDKVKKECDQNLDTFAKRLIDGYFLATDQLISNVKESLDTIDVPAGLTAEAVKSIMKRPRCICGCDMDDDIRARLTSLLSTLPPDNISSNILYMANQFENEKRRAKDLLKESYDALMEKREELAALKAKLAEISSSLVTSVSENVKNLEKEHNSLIQSQGAYNAKIETLGLEIERKKKRLKEAQKELDDVAGNLELLKELTAQVNVLELFKEAIKKIGERNKELSLISINEYLSRAYTRLSEDTGRRLYLCQFDKKGKYGLLTYFQSKYDEMRIRWINEGHLRKYESVGLSEGEIHEKLVTEVAEGKSTGQSKINSLAFAKAILEYSNADRSADELKISHEYPFLIDSPFTELSDENLTNVAKHIHTFAKQVLIMADDTSYAGVESLLAPYVNTKTQLVKDKNKGITYVK